MMAWEYGGGGYRQQQEHLVAELGRVRTIRPAGAAPPKEAMLEGQV